MPELLNSVINVSAESTISTVNLESIARPGYSRDRGYIDPNGRTINLGARDWFLFRI